jgi:hypothetical protein
MGALFSIRSRTRDITNMFDPLRAVVDVLGQFKVAIKPDVLTDLGVVPGLWDKTTKMYHSAREAVKPLVENEIANVRGDAEAFSSEARPLLSPHLDDEIPLWA